MKLASFFCLYFLLLSAIADAVPESNRSRKAIEKVLPLLREEFDSKGLKLGAPIFIRIFKESKELEIWVKKKETFRLFKTYAIHYFSGNLGPKLREGDRQAPEGFYYVPASQMNPNSRFHLSFNLGYPNKYDRGLGRTGSALMVHGSTVSIGCFAMTDPVIEEVYAIADLALRGGQKFFRVHIFPFRMTREAMKDHKDSQWIGFWRNLKEGYDFFESNQNPPNVEVLNRRYIFEHSTQ